MAQTITPVVHGGRRGRWVGTLALHALGATVAAASLGAILGAIGALLGGPWGTAGRAVVVVVALLYAARELLGVGVPIPDLRRQVPEWWRGWLRPSGAAFLYGLGLGVGYLTHLRHGTLVAVSVGAVAVADPVLGAVALGPFGLARAIAVGVAWRARSEDTAGGVGERLERIGATRAPSLANGVILLALAAAALLTSIPWGPGPPGWLGAAVLAAVFGWAALSKAFAPRRWLRSLDAYALPLPLRVPAAVLVPVAEAGVALAAFFTAGSAGIVALALLTAFSAAIVRARSLHGARLPCGCFGTAVARDWRGMLARNAAIAVAAALAVVTDAAVPLPTSPEPLPALLTIGGIGLVVALLVRSSDALRDARGGVAG